MMANNAVKEDIIEKLKVGEFSNKDLTSILIWGINKNHLDIFDLLIDNPHIDFSKMRISCFESLMDKNQFSRFEQLVIYTKPDLPISWFNSFKFLVSCCEKPEYLNMIINTPSLDFNDVIRKAYKYGYYEGVSIILQHRKDIDPSIYDAYSKVFRYKKLKRIKEKMKLVEHSKH